MSASLAESLASLPEAERAAILAGLSDRDHAELEYDWRFWGRPEQFAPPGDWANWFVLAGRGFGKTRLGAEWVREEVTSGRASRIALVAETAADGRDVMVEGPSGLLACHAPADRPEYEPSKRRVTWPNGAIATVFNAVEPDQLRGPQFDAAWCDELAKWRYADATWDQLAFGMRLGDHPRICITTTPRPVPLVRKLIADKRTAITRGSTFDNARNLAPSFIASIRERYEGTRLGRQELEAEILDDVLGALWTRELLDETRVRPHEAPSEYRQVVIGVDPPVTSGENADECGIVAAGLALNDHAFIIEDDSSQGETPEQWAARVIRAFRRHRANYVVVEVNNGGDLVTGVLRQVDPNVPVIAVHASRGKARRAEPIATFYERKLCHHIGAFAKLEDQMCAMTPDFDAKSAGYSPDRCDAMVWGMTHLIAGPTPFEWRVV